MAEQTVPITDEENDDLILARTQKARLDLLGDLESLKGDVLNSKTTAEAFVSITAAIDKQVFDKRKSHREKEDSKNASVFRAAALETLNALKTRQAALPKPTGVERDMPEDFAYIPVPGETDINPPPLNYNDFLGEED